MVILVNDPRLAVPGKNIENQYNERKLIKGTWLNPLQFQTVHLHHYSSFLCTGFHVSRLQGERIKICNEKIDKKPIKLRYKQFLPIYCCQMGGGLLIFATLICTL